MVGDDLVELGLRPGAGVAGAVGVRTGAEDIDPVVEAFETGKSLGAQYPRLVSGILVRNVSFMWIFSDDQV